MKPHPYINDSGNKRRPLDPQLVQDAIREQLTKEFSRLRPKQRRCSNISIELRTIGSSPYAFVLVRLRKELKSFQRLFATTMLADGSLLTVGVPTQVNNFFFHACDLTTTQLLAFVSSHVQISTTIPDYNVTVARQRLVKHPTQLKKVGQ